MNSVERSRILLLDDEPMVTRALGTLLEMSDGFEPILFNIPEAALDFLERERVEAILSDFVMPGMDGLQFLEAARRVQPAATRLLLTGYADKQSAIRAINEVGLFRYLEKPWDNDEILITLRNAAERCRLIRRLEDKTQDFEKLRAEIRRVLL